MEQNIGVAFTQDSVLRDNIFSHFSRTYHRIIKNVYINNPLTQDIKNTTHLSLMRYMTL